MSMVCELCGKRPMSGNHVSHAHNLTRRRWKPNIQKVRAVINGTVRKIRICAKCLKSGKVQKPALNT